MASVDGLESGSSLGPDQRDQRGPWAGVFKTCGGPPWVVFVPLWAPGWPEKTRPWPWAGLCLACVGPPWVVFGPLWAPGRPEKHLLPPIGSQRSKALPWGEGATIHQFIRACIPPRGPLLSGNVYMQWSPSKRWFSLRWALTKPPTPAHPRSPARKTNTRSMTE